MNQEQVDAMCPEERRRREEVKRRFRMLPGVDTMPFSPKILSWRGHMECLVRQWREMDEEAFYLFPGCRVSLLTIWGGLKTWDRHLKRNIHQVAMKI